MQDSRVVVGGPRLLSESNVLVPSEVAKLTAAWLSEGKTVLYVVSQGRLLGAFAAEDEIRPESAEAVSELHRLGIRVAMISGYLNTFRGCIMSVAHCIDNYVPGIMQWAEMYDVAGLIAPRPVFIESGTKDTIFPIASSVQSFERLKKVYEVFGVGDAAEQEVFEGPHSFWGQRGLPFVSKNLGV